MSKLIENVYKNFFAPNREYFLKQDLNRLRKKTISEWQFAAFYVYSKLRTTECKEDYRKVGKSKVGFRFTG